MGYFEILCGIAVVLFGIYYYLTCNFNFWKSRGIRGPQPMLGFGNIWDIFLVKKSIPDYVIEIYNDYKDESFVGIFENRTPVLIVKDPDIIKNILIKDFTTFADRGFAFHEKLDPLSQNLFALEPRRWRPLRASLTPIFTTHKLKEMFAFVSQCADLLELYVEKLASKNEPVECCELTAQYTTDVIGICVFGLEMNALLDEESEFRRMGRQIFCGSWENVIRFRLIHFFPWLCDIFSYILPEPEVNKFLKSVIIKTMAYRDANNIVRHDFIDTLRELKKHPEKLGDINLTENFITAQAYLFFAAGFETSSTTMTHALYELALNKKVQNKLREEINEAYIKHTDNFTYENIKEMNYLDKVFKETLRKYPPGTVLSRQSTTSYTFDGINLNIPKHTKIWIPVFSIQRDPDVYPKPDVFDPERFSDEAVQARHAMHYLPFGDGPRNCIGARLGVYQVKLGLIKILRNYRVETCEKTQITYVIDPKRFVLAPKGGIYLRLIKINQSSF